MRQTAPRRAPEKTAAKPRVKAGEHLDLGITVSVYCADSIRAQPTEHPTDESGTGFTEH